MKHVSVQAEYSKHTTEEYVVKFWYHSFESGFWRQGEASFWAKDKYSHEEVERFAQKYLSKTHQSVNIFAVVYQ